MWLVGAALTGPPALAASAAEVAADAARLGKLDVVDVASLELQHPTCLLWSPKTRQAFCVAIERHRGPASVRYVGVIVGATARSATRHVLATFDEADDEMVGDAAGVAAINKALSGVSWSARPVVSDSYTVKAPAPSRPARIELAKGSVRADVEVLAVAGEPVVVAVADCSDSTCSARGTLTSRFVMASQDPAVVACPTGMWCPPNHAVLAPFLGQLCRGNPTDTDADAVAKCAQRGELVADDLAVLFNAYGALYGYTFKTRTEFNRYFYGPRGTPPASAEEGSTSVNSWLPPSCRNAIGLTKRSELTKAQRHFRDRVKATWRKHR